MEFNAGELLQWIINAVAMASIIANFTPTPKDNVALAFISKVINAVALNITTPPGVAEKPADSNTLKSFALFALILVASVVASPYADAQTGARLECDPPSERVDGSPLPAAEIVGYLFWRGGQALNDSPATACSYAITLSPGQCIEATEPFQVAAIATGIDGQYLTSDRSDPAFAGERICYPKAAPGSPGNVTVIRF